MKYIKKLKMPKIGIVIFWIILITVWIISGVMMFWSKMGLYFIKNKDYQYKMEKFGMFFFFICGTIVLVSMRSGSDD